MVTRWGLDCPDLSLPSWASDISSLLRLSDLHPETRADLGRPFCSRVAKKKEERKKPGPTFPTLYLSVYISGSPKYLSLCWQGLCLSFLAQWWAYKGCSMDALWIKSWLNQLVNRCRPSVRSLDFGLKRQTFTFHLRGLRHGAYPTVPLVSYLWNESSNSTYLQGWEESIQTICQAPGMEWDLQEVSTPTCSNLLRENHRKKVLMQPARKIPVLGRTVFHDPWGPSSVLGQSYFLFPQISSHSRGPRWGRDFQRPCQAQRGASAEMVRKPSWECRSLSSGLLPHHPVTFDSHNIPPFSPQFLLHAKGIYAHSRQFVNIFFSEKN